MNTKFKVVDRTYDYLPSEAYSFDELKSKLLKVFTDRGYRKIDTPVLENYELFASGVGNVPNKKLFKLTDTDGSLLVLRPDMTLPIARVVNTKMSSNKYNKLCYVANSYALNPAGAAIREFTQAGIELYEKSNAYVDADVIALAIMSLISAGLKNFQIDIGHVGYFKGLLEELNLDALAQDQLVKLVDAKDSLGLELFAKENNLFNQVNTILNLPTIFGGVEVLDKALNYTRNKGAVAAIDNLKAIYSVLVNYGLDNYITFDLGLVNGVSYYSGVVFKGITRYYGADVLSGGRYDELSSSFGGTKPAIGFAIGVNNLLSAVRKENGEPISMPKVDVLVGGDLSQVSVINNQINHIIKQGLIVENSYINDYTAFMQRLTNSDVIRGVFIDVDGKLIEVYNG